MEVSIPEVLIKDKRANRSTIEVYCFIRDTPEAKTMSIRSMAKVLDQTAITVSRNMYILDALGLIQYSRSRFTLTEAVNG